MVSSVVVIDGRDYAEVAGLVEVGGSKIDHVKILQNLASMLDLDPFDGHFYILPFEQSIGVDNVPPPLSNSKVGLSVVVENETTERCFANTLSAKIVDCCYGLNHTLQYDRIVVISSDPALTPVCEHIELRSPGCLSIVCVSGLDLLPRSLQPFAAKSKTGKHISLLKLMRHWLAPLQIAAPLPQRSASSIPFRKVVLTSNPQSRGRDVAKIVADFWKYTGKQPQQPSQLPEGAGLPKTAASSVLFDPTDDQPLTDVTTAGNYVEDEVGIQSETDEKPFQPVDFSPTTAIHNTVTDRNSSSACTFKPIVTTQKYDEPPTISTSAPDSAEGNRMAADSDLFATIARSEEGVAATVVSQGETSPCVSSTNQASVHTIATEGTRGTVCTEDTVTAVEITEPSPSEEQVMGFVDAVSEGQEKSRQPAMLPMAPYLSQKSLESSTDKATDGMVSTSGNTDDSVHRVIGLSTATHTQMLSVELEDGEVYEEEPDSDSDKYSSTVSQHAPKTPHKVNGWPEKRKRGPDNMQGDGGLSQIIVEARQAVQKRHRTVESSAMADSKPAATAPAQLFRNVWNSVHRPPPPAIASAPKVKPSAPPLPPSRQLPPTQPSVVSKRPMPPREPLGPPQSQPPQTMRPPPPPYQPLQPPQPLSNRWTPPPPLQPMPTASCATSIFTVARDRQTAEMFNTNVHCENVAPVVNRQLITANLAPALPSPVAVAVKTPLTVITNNLSAALTHMPPYNATDNGSDKSVRGNAKIAPTLASSVENANVQRQW